MTTSTVRPRTVELRTACTANQIDLEARDGRRIAATSFTPLSGHAVGTVIIHGATATRARYYARFAEYLATEGMRVLTYDYRGVGASRPRSLRGFQATMTEWATLDATAAETWVDENYPGEPVAIIGHSFGGQLLGLIEGPARAKAIVLVGAQLGYYKHWDTLDSLRLGLIWRALVPALTSTVGYLPGKLGIGEDLPRGVAEEWARWCLQPEYFLAEHRSARERFARIDAPALLYSFTDDTFAPRRAVDQLELLLASAKVHKQRLSPAEVGVKSIGHFGFFRERFRESLWADAAHFVSDALVGAPPRLPTRADTWNVQMSDILADLHFGQS